MELMYNRPLFFISNDDGYYAKGIRSLINMLRTMADLVVVAPDSARSGASCSITSTVPLQLTLRKEEEGLIVYSCNGSPVDCIKLGLAEVCPRKPDKVIAGINYGDNASVNAHYSGTMGIVFEGCMKGISSVAFSLCNIDSNASFSSWASPIIAITKKVLGEGLPKQTCLNVNIPDVGSCKGIKVCRMTYGEWSKEFVKRLNPRGYPYYWLTGEYTNCEPDADDTDRWALANGYIAITPTQIDVTAYELLNKMKSWTF